MTSIFLLKSLAHTQAPATEVRLIDSSAVSLIPHLVAAPTLAITGMGYGMLSKSVV